MSDHWVSLPTGAASQNGTGTKEANWPINQNKPILARVLEVTKLMAMDICHRLYIQGSFLFIAPFHVVAHLNTCISLGNSKSKS